MTDPGGASVRAIIRDAAEAYYRDARNMIAQGGAWDDVNAEAYILEAVHRAVRPVPAATPPAFYDACPMCGGIEEHGGEEMSQACEAFERVVHWSRTDPPPPWLTTKAAPSEPAATPPHREDCYKLTEGGPCSCGVTLQPGPRGPR